MSKAKRASTPNPLPHPLQTPQRTPNRSLCPSSKKDAPPHGPSTSTRKTLGGA
ncbi:hypothetical protein PGTUg99_007506 [Puccinia graminis f. sp. tritici]|uniref:Uncharacterized protein n=1 Tax=Puccinia graminis f. sp. tritici TaxID=56615 RepID=A0A5B0S323_PUCGR|nr:hypothetical protein PGTUg99_007506 [Puccinia graminis f. sp. tritici]